MKNLLTNLLTPPPVKTAGQIWRLDAFDIDVVITDATYAESTGVVRASVLVKTTALHDGVDVLLQESDELPGKRLVLRITDGPVLVSQLRWYLGKVRSLQLTKIQKSLKNTNFISEAWYQDAIEPLMIRSGNLHASALQQFEVQLAEREPELTAAASRRLGTPVFRITNYVPAVPGALPCVYRFTGADSESQSMLQKFWRSELAAPHLILEESRSTLVRLSYVDGYLYLVIHSDEWTQLKKVVVTYNDNSTVLPAEINISAERRAFVALPAGITSGTALGISLMIDKKRRNYKTVVQYE